MLRAHRFGGVRLGLLLGIVALGGLWGGLQNLHTAATNRAPAEMSVREYVQSTPRADWLTLTHAYLNVLDGAHLYKESRSASAPADRIYLGVYASEEDWYGDMPPRIVFETRDPSLVQPYNELLALAEDTVETWIEANWDRLHDVRTVSGLVRFGIEMNSRDRDLLRVAFQSDEIIVLADGEQPSLAVGVIATLIGLLAAYLALRQFGLFRRQDDDAPPTTEPDTAQPAADIDETPRS